MKTICLGDLVRIIGGGTPDRSVSEYWGKGIPWVTVKDFKEIEISSALESITELGLQSSASNLIEAGSILVPTRMALGKAAINTVDVAINQDLKAIQILDSSLLDQRYLLRFLLSKSSYFESRGKGATVKGITLDVLRELPVPLPPLEEQQRIAAILDKADSLRRKRAQAIALADDFLRATFLDMFGDPVTNYRKWPEKEIYEIAKVTTGNTPSREMPENFGSAIEWIKSDNINTPSHWLTKAAEGLSEQGLFLGRTVHAGATLMTCIAGSSSCIGNVAMADRQVAFNQQINALTPFEGTEPEFLYGLLLYSKQRIQAASTNSMKGMVSKGTLERIRLIWPPTALQSAYAMAFRKITILREKQLESEFSPVFLSLQDRLLS